MLKNIHHNFRLCKSNITQPCFYIAKSSFSLACTIGTNSTCIIKKQVTPITQPIYTPVFWFNSLFSTHLFKRPFQYPHQSMSAQTTYWSIVSMSSKLQRSTKWKPFTFLQGQATWWVILPYAVLNQSTVQSFSGALRTVKEA